MSATRLSSTKVAQLQSLLLPSLPLGIGILLLTMVSRLDTVAILALCGVIVALVGGITKIGSV